MSAQQALSLAPAVAHRLVVLGAPRTKKNHARIVRNRATGQPFIIQGASAQGWEKTAVLQLKAQWRGRPPLGGPVHVAALVYRDRAVGDLINFLSSVSDALERAGVVCNDRQIVSWDGSRPLKDADRPRVEITISETEEP
jgi:Holliday junction resolvase RusA-like endonuclease